MISIWPWRAESSSTATFEKTLSLLSLKITKNQARLDKFRSRSRRVKVLSTLYLSFAYLVYAIVIILVVGYRNTGPYEWSGLAGGPVIIYTTRTLLSTYYNFRINTLASRLKLHTDERAKTIQKLKDATKYDSTMELIQKYGGPDKSPDPTNLRRDDPAHPNHNTHQKQSGAQPGAQHRTTMPPPPTANIQRPSDPSISPNTLEPTAEFAPNAGPEYAHLAPLPHLSSQSYATGQQQYPPHQPSHWYDRIFDVLLGEDETAPKNRIVLLCFSCRLVNGQAPPGAKTLVDIGRWRCMACGAENGGEDDGRRIFHKVLGEQPAEQSPGEEFKPEVDDDSTNDEHGVPNESDGDPASSVKKRRGRGEK